MTQLHGIKLCYKPLEMIYDLLNWAKSGDA